MLRLWRLFYAMSTFTKQTIFEPSTYYKIQDERGRPCLTDLISVHKLKIAVTLSVLRPLCTIKIYIPFDLKGYYSFGYLIWLCFMLLMWYRHRHFLASVDPIKWLKILSLLSISQDRIINLFVIKYLFISSISRESVTAET